MDSRYERLPLCLSARGEGVQDRVTAARMTPLPLGRWEPGAPRNPPRGLGAHQVAEADGVGGRVGIPHSEPREIWGRDSGSGLY